MHDGASFSISLSVVSFKFEVKKEGSGRYLGQVFSHQFSVVRGSKPRGRTFLLCTIVVEMSTKRKLVCT